MKYVEAIAVKEKIMRYAFYERDCIAVVTEGLRNADVLGITRSQCAIEFEIKVSRSDLQKELAAIQYALKTTTGHNLAPADNDPEQLALNMELGKLKQKAGGWSKIKKHEEHLDPTKYFVDRPSWAYGTLYMPNRFYIVVPDKLVGLAIDGLQGTPYGVIASDGCRGAHSAYYSKSRDCWYSNDFKYSELPEDAHWQTAPCSAVPDRCYPEVAVKKKANSIHADKINPDIMVSITQRTINENLSLLAEVRSLNELVKRLREKMPCAPAAPDAAA